jgi:hypothetical protein
MEVEMIPKRRSRRLAHSLPPLVDVAREAATHTPVSPGVPINHQPASPTENLTTEVNIGSGDNSQTNESSSLSSFTFPTNTEDLLECPVSCFASALHFITQAFNIGPQ